MALSSMNSFQSADKPLMMSKVVMNKSVVDASALLAYLFEEPGAELVAELLDAGSALVSSVNYAETVSKLVDRKMPEEVVKITMENLGLEVVSYDEQQALLTGLFRKSCLSHGLSLGDRACFALARVAGYPVMTADRVWQEVPLDAEICLIR